jgi:hypothetical protein
MPLEFGQKARRMFPRDRSGDLIFTADLFRDNFKRQLLLDAAPDACACPV